MEEHDYHDYQRLQCCSPRRIQYDQLSLQVTVEIENNVLSLGISNFYNFMSILKFQIYMHLACDEHLHA